MKRLLSYGLFFCLSFLSLSAMAALSSSVLLQSTVIKPAESTQPSTSVELKAPAIPAASTEEDSGSALRTQVSG